MTPDELKTAVRAAVREEFMNVGWYDDEVKEMRKDFIWLRVTRIRCTSISNKFVVGVVAGLTTLFLGALGGGMLAMAKAGGL